MGDEEEKKSDSKDIKAPLPQSSDGNSNHTDEIHGMSMDRTTQILSRGGEEGADHGGGNNSRRSSKRPNNPRKKRGGKNNINNHNGRAHTPTGLDQPLFEDSIVSHDHHNNTE